MPGHGAPKSCQKGSGKGGGGAGLKESVKGKRLTQPKGLKTVITDKGMTAKENLMRGLWGASGHQKGHIAPFYDDPVEKWPDQWGKEGGIEGRGGQGRKGEQATGIGDLPFAPGDNGPFLLTWYNCGERRGENDKKRKRPTGSRTAEEGVSCRGKV